MSAAVVGERGPISTVLLFSVSDDFVFHFATHRDSFKAKALLSDGRISMAVWQHNMMLVQADGVATEVTEPEKAKQILDELAQAVEAVGDFWPPILRISGDGYILFEIRLKWLRALDLVNLSIVAGEPPFTEFNF